MGKRSSREDRPVRVSVLRRSAGYLVKRLVEVASGSAPAVSEPLAVWAQLALCGCGDIQTSSEETCTLGVDTGRSLHVVISHRIGETRLRGVIYLVVHRSFTELDDLMKRFSVYCCVIDSLAEPHAARAFANRRWGSVFLDFFVETQKGSTHWDHKKHIVRENRTVQRSGGGGGSAMEAARRQPFCSRRAGGADAPDITSESSREARVVPSGLGAGERRDVAVVIQQSVHLDGSLRPAELRPREHTEGEIHGAGVEGVDLLLKRNRCSGAWTRHWWYSFMKRAS